MSQGPNILLTKNFRADSAVTKYRIITKGTAEDDAAQASAATQPLYGIAQETVADNAMVDVALSGISYVEYGGTVTQGDTLTTDASGRAVVATRHTHTENTAAAYTQNATTGAGSSVYTIGIAMANGVLSDIATVLIQPSFS